MNAARPEGRGFLLAAICYSSEAVQSDKLDLAPPFGDALMDSAAPVASHPHVIPFGREGKRLNP
jgi:hypothetical protein